MIRKAFVMSVRPGCEAEYARRHQPIWPELELTLLEHGVRSYSIFLRLDTHELYAYVEFESEAEWEAIARTDVCQRWWVHMSSLMPSHPNHSPIAHPLIEVFHLETACPKAG
jgi:L-rhamnose mutarotase